MELLILFSAVLIIITKLADVLTTLRFIKVGSIAMERNKLARKLMYRFGAKPTVWFVFLLAIIIVAFAVWDVLASGKWWYQWSFVIIASFVSVMQASVAYYNFTGKYNSIVRFVSRCKFYI